MYLSDYADPSSSAYKALAAEIQSDMLSFFQSSNETSGITGVKVTALRNGSVLADMTIASQLGTLSASTVANSVNNGIANGNLASLGATGTIQVQGT